jgi:hypothetical protein
MTVNVYLELQKTRKSSASGHMYSQKLCKRCSLWRSAAPASYQTLYTQIYRSNGSSKSRMVRCALSSSCCHTAAVYTPQVLLTLLLLQHELCIPQHFSSMHLQSQPLVTTNTTLLSYFKYNQQPKATRTCINGQFLCSVCACMQPLHSSFRSSLGNCLLIHFCAALVSCSHGRLHQPPAALRQLRSL